MWQSSQLPTGGAVYFDGGVLEVVTPVIEIALTGETPSLLDLADRPSEYDDVGHAVR